MLQKLLTGLQVIAKIDNWRQYAVSALGFRCSEDLIKFRNGIQFRIRADDNDRWIVEEVWVKKIYALPGFEIQSDDTVIDIGAHVGSFSVFAASRARSGRVICFEPFKESYDLLNHNAALNNVTLAAVHKAVGGKSGVVTLYFSKSDTCRNSLYFKQEEFVQVECVALEDIFRTYEIANCNFLKIDCEGAEFDILLGAPPAILERIDKIALEYHDAFVGFPDALPKGYHHGVLQTFLEQRGFRVTLKPPMMYAMNEQYVKRRLHG
jgi:FkbM family methyltransferase